MRYPPKTIGALFAGIALLAGTAAAAQNRPTTAPTESRGDGAMRADSNGDGVITRTEAMAAADARFTRADANRDGRLTPEDRAQRAEQAGSAAFARMDGNRDGSISRTEWDQARSQRGEQRAASSAEQRTGARRPAGAQRGGGRQALARLADSNNDGGIDRAEFMAVAAQRFARGDADNDGNLTTAERDAQRAARRTTMRGQQPRQR